MTSGHDTLDVQSTQYGVNATRYNNNSAHRAASISNVDNKLVAARLVIREA